MCRGAVDRALNNIPEAVAEADLVVLATPCIRYSTSCPGCRAYAPGAVLIDLGSTKARIMAAMEGLPPR